MALLGESLHVLVGTDILDDAWVCLGGLRPRNKPEGPAHYRNYANRG